TGVQTCALPICFAIHESLHKVLRVFLGFAPQSSVFGGARSEFLVPRSESGSYLAHRSARRATQRGRAADAHNRARVTPDVVSTTQMRTVGEIGNTSVQGHG